MYLFLTEWTIKFSVVSKESALFGGSGFILFCFIYISLLQQTNSAEWEPMPWGPHTALVSVSMATPFLHLLRKYTTSCVCPQAAPQLSLPLMSLTFLGPSPVIQVMIPCKFALLLFVLVVSGILLRGLLTGMNFSPLVFELNYIEAAIIFYLWPHMGITHLDANLTSLLLSTAHKKSSTGPDMSVEEEVSLNICG